MPDSSEAELDRFIDRYSPRVADLARAALAKMRSRLPGAFQLVYDNYNALAIGFGPSERASEAVFSIALYPRWVSLFFLHGSNLADPHGVLQGSGKRVRHVVLKDASDLDAPAIRELMDEALKEDPIDPAAGGKLIIRSVSGKQRKRRATS